MTYTIYIEKGPNAACADFAAVSVDQALIDASRLWREPVDNLAILPPEISQGYFPEEGSC